jgi:hypothetical protein
MHIKAISMKLLLSYETDIGTFYIGKCEQNLYHPIFNDQDLGSHRDMWVAVKNLTDNTTQPVLHPETNEAVDTSTLGTPDDYLGWVRMKS